MMARVLLAVVLHLTLYGAVGGNTLSKEYVIENGRTLWRNFKAQYRREYGDDDARRMEVFLRNLLKAVEMKKRNPHAEFGENMLADLDEEEFKRMRGLVLPEGKKSKYNKITLDTSVYVNQTRPLGATNGTDCHSSDSINLNWVNAGVVTHVKSQGSCGSCWAFSTTGAIEAQWAISGHPLVSLSEQELVSCSSSPNSGCYGGLPEDAFTWLLTVKHGEIKTEASYPYVEQDWKEGPPVPCDPTTDEKPTGAVISLVQPLDNNEIQMYAALKHYGPVSIAVDADSWQAYTGGIMTDCISNRVDHGVLLVGHGYDATKNLEYWVIKNSWGSNWGENGYIRVAFGSNQCLITAWPVVALTPSLPAVPGVVPDPDSPTGLAPTVITPAPLDPTVAVPRNPDIDATCIAGSECTCPSVLFITGKAGSDICTVTIVIPICGVIFFTLLGALLMTYISPRNGMTEEDLRKLLKEYKAKQQSTNQLNQINHQGYHTVAN